MKAVHLYGDYCSHPETRKSVRLLGALSFLPEELVPRIFRALGNRLQSSGLLTNHPQLEPIYLYVATNYIGRVDDLGRSIAPLYPVASWNQWQRIINRLPRSDATIEGFHVRAIQTLTVHSQIDVFVERLLVIAFCENYPFLSFFIHRILTNTINKFMIGLKNFFLLIGPGMLRMFN